MNSHQVWMKCLNIFTYCFKKFQCFIFSSLSCSLSLDNNIGYKLNYFHIIWPCYGSKRLAARKQILDHILYAIFAIIIILQKSFWSCLLACQWVHRAATYNKVGPKQLNTISFSRAEVVNQQICYGHSCLFFHDKVSPLLNLHKIAVLVTENQIK